MERRRILVIEDDDLQYELYEEALKDYELIRSKRASQALASEATSGGLTGV